MTALAPITATSLAATIRDAVAHARSADHPMTIADAVALVPAAAIGAFLHPSFQPHAQAGGQTVVTLTVALGASPGAASGEVVLTADDAIEAAAAGRAVILVRCETTPDDVLGMQSARGILTARGGLASHAAVVARGWGIPAVVGAGELLIEPDCLRIGEHRITAGTVISIDGRTGEVFLGALSMTTEEAPEELEVLLDWADRIRHGADHPVAVRVNADTAADAAHARYLGAEGIGLCRTEHMFLADDRLPLVRRFILTDDPAEEAAALADLERTQQEDFEGIFAAMDGLPITVRLLDPPLHEFMPDLERLVVADATDQLDDAGRAELAAVRRMHEVNPMIGTRGVRLGVVKPGVYQMQVRALCRAIAGLVATGRTPAIEVMIPLVVDSTEMRAARDWVAEAAADVAHASGTLIGPALSVGAMIETPRAALVAGELAAVSDFFSFGTNDLTQLTFAFSRDDVGSKLLPLYLRAGLLSADPFETLDQVGVGRLVRGACDDARAARPEIKIGVCGEQAGDPASARFFVRCGVDYVSCSPYRVPIARLAVAQALLESGRVGDAVLAAIAATPDRTCDETAAAEAPMPPRADETAGETAGEVPSPPVDAPVGEEVEFAVLHALRIKGFASVEAIADIACIEPPAVLHVVTTLLEAGHVRHIAARDLYQLLAPGRDRHTELLAIVPRAAVSGLREHYEAFLDLNLAFKAVCTGWQTRNSEPNDHTDAEYDGGRIAELHRLHDRAEPVLAGFGAAHARFDSYRTRLTGALARTEAGEARMFTGVMCGSYHDVWMELHEDLIQILGIDRHAEGSF